MDEEGDELHLPGGATSGWSSNVGLFFHVFGHCSVNSLHLHIVDLNHVGPTFKRLSFKNCPLDSIIKAAPIQPSRIRHRRWWSCWGWCSAKLQSAKIDRVTAPQCALQPRTSASKGTIRMDTCEEGESRVSSRSARGPQDRFPGM